MNIQKIKEKKISVLISCILAVVSIIVIIGFIMLIRHSGENKHNNGYTETAINEDNTTDNVAEDTTEDTPDNTPDNTAGNTPDNTSNNTSDNTPEIKITVDNTTEDTTEDTTTSVTNLTIDEQVEMLLQSMTLEEKVYQMIIVAPEQLTGYASVTAAGETTRQCLVKYPVGGLIYFANNIVTPNQTQTMISNTQKYAMEIENIPLFICVDEEGGRVARIGNNSAFNVESFNSMSTIADEIQAYHVGDTIGRYLNQYGFNFDFAPDADVITNPDNTVIGDRSFGTDADKVTKLAIAVSNGLRANNVLSTFKHFPGHGATEGDTHEGFAYTNKTYEELLKSELKPFMAAGTKDVDAVMVAHISVPNIVGDNTPCTLSEKMITDILRGDLNYQGLIVTDALNMKAITNLYTSSEAAVLAVKAGNDILLMPDNFKEAAAGVINAVARGEISEERINESVRRIINKKITLQEN